MMILATILTDRLTLWSDDVARFGEWRWLLEERDRLLLVGESKNEDFIEIGSAGRIL